MEKLIIIYCFSLLIYGCEKSSNDYALKDSIVINNNKIHKERDACLSQINKKLICFLSDIAKLQNYLKIDGLEANIIFSRLNKNSFTSERKSLIVKLSELITDTTYLPIYCTNFIDTKVCVGDLALLSIYRVEEFPFAAALGRQWCTGGIISKDIQLPYNLVEYTSFKREDIQKAYKAYYHSADRIEFLNSNK